jgi:hypothetical protein
MLENANQTILITSGARSVGLGLLLRAGTDFYLTDQFQIYADAGIGPTVIQFGVAINVGNF